MWSVRRYDGCTEQPTEWHCHHSSAKKSLQRNLCFVHDTLLASCWCCRSVSWNSAALVWYTSTLQSRWMEPSMVNSRHHNPIDLQDLWRDAVMSLPDECTGRKPFDTPCDWFPEGNGTRRYWRRYWSLTQTCLCNMFRPEDDTLNIQSDLLMSVISCIEIGR